MNTRPPLLRPWLQTGLSFLLLENEERVKELMAGERAKKGQSAQKTRAPLPAQGRRTVAANPVERQERSPQTSPAMRTPPTIAARPAPPASPSPEIQKEREYALPGVLPESAWPASWQALKNRRKLPSSPLVLWTYAGLEEDLMGAANRERQQFITRMLVALKHPGGTHVFWPYALPGEEVLQQPSLFWSGVALFDPRVLLLFGSDARDALAMPRSLRPFCQERMYGRAVIQLPNPQAFIGDEAAFARVLAFLASSLRFCTRR